MSKKGGKGSLVFRVVAMLAILVLVTTVLNLAGFGRPSQLGVGDFGYSSAFEGPKAKFYGLTWDPNGNGQRRYSATQWSSPASLHQFDTIMKFDGDEANSGKPNIVGEMTSVFIPRESLGSIPSWLPMSWINTMNYIQNPQAKYNWTINEKDYYMEQWLLRYYVTFSAEWDGSTDMFGGHGEAPPQSNYPGGDNSYGNLNVWIELDTEPTWYIQGQGVAYFAIGKVQLANDVNYFSTAINHGGIFDSGKGTARNDVSVAPEAAPSLSYLYYQPYGDGQQQVHESSYYMGKELNPAYFSAKTFMQLTFNKFGCYGDSGSPPFPVGFWTKGDTATFAFDVTVFVVGQWNVQDIQNDPSNYGRFQRVDSGQGFFDWLLSAQTLAWLIPVAIFVALIFFAPWVIIMLIALFRGGNRR